MARVAINTALSEFETIVKSMRKLGVASWENSPVGSIILGPEPSPQGSATPADANPLEERRRHYQELFGRSVTDAELKNLPGG